MHFTPLLADRHVSNNQEVRCAQYSETAATRCKIINHTMINGLTRLHEKVNYSIPKKKKNGADGNVFRGLKFGVPAVPGPLSASPALPRLKLLLE